ncbi:Uncharacterised protein [Mycobacterium tuberculosis]|nr:Uncharacterised protein [Mycobacterium tuberculosis]
MLRRQILVVGDQPDLGGGARDGGQWCAQVTPGRRGTDVGEFHRPTVVSGGRLLVGGPLQPDLAGVESPGRRHHQQRRPVPLLVGGQPVPARPQHGGHLHAGSPAAQHRCTGRVQVVGQPGAGAVDSRCGRGAPFGAGFAAGDQPVVVEETAIPWTFHHRVGGDVGGNAVGCEGFRQAGSQGVGQRRGHRRQHACVGIQLHQHVFGQPAGLAGQSL